MKNKIFILNLFFILALLSACGRQEDSSKQNVTGEEQENEIAEIIAEPTQIPAGKEDISTSGQESAQAVKTRKHIAVSETDYDYVLSDVTSIHKKEDGTEEYDIHGIFGFNLPSENLYLYSFYGFNSDHPFDTRKLYETTVIGDAETEITNNKFDCLQSLGFSMGEINKRIDWKEYPVLHIALAREKEIIAGEGQVSNTGYLKTVLQGDSPKKASIETFQEYELRTLEKEENVDTPYGETQIMYQVTSHKINENTWYDSEREIVVLPITDFNELVYFGDDFEQKKATPATEYDVIIEYIYPKADSAGGYQHVLADMLPQILNKK